MLVEATGTGGLSDMLEAMAQPNQIFWAALRVVSVTKTSEAVHKQAAYVRFTQVGCHVDSRRRYQVMKHTSTINELMASAAVHLQIQSDDKVEMKAIAQGLIASGLTKPDSFDFGGGESYAATSVLDTFT